jgi:hypothetical protein
LGALFGRHEHVAVLPRDKVEQGAAFGGAWNNGDLTGLAAFEGVLPVVEPVAALLFLGTVAGRAVVLQNGENVP